LGITLREVFTFSTSVWLRLLREATIDAASQSPPALFVWLHAALDHVGDQVRQAAPALIGDSEEVFEAALGEGDDGALAELARRKGKG
jgi:hypothetical protein